MRHALVPLMLAFSAQLGFAADTQLSTGPAYVGVDPGGAEMLRVGGGLRTTGASTVAGTLGVQADTANALQVTGTSANAIALRVANATTGGRDYSLGSSGASGPLATGGFFVYDNTAGVNRLAIDGAGNVGIGVAPAYKLHVADGSSAWHFTTISSCPTFRLASTFNVTDDLIFNTVGVDQVRLRGSSYGLAIGGANPRLNIGYADANYAESLRANGSALIGGNVGIGAAPVAGQGQLQIMPGAGNVVARLNGGGASAGDGSAAVFGQGGSYNQAIGNWSSIIGGTFDNTGLLFSATAWKLTTGGAAVRMHIDNAGKVGIGVTPAYKLHVADGGSELQFASVSSNPTLRLGTAQNVYDDLIFNTSGADQVSIRASSYGLNVTGANPRLSIGGADLNRAEALFVNGATKIAPTTGDAALNLVAGTAGLTLTQLSSNDAVLGTTTANGLLLRTNGTNRMYVASNGSVAIGTDPGGSELMRVGGGLRIGGGSLVTLGATGAAAPSFTTRSAGTKLVLFDALSASTTDFALGIDAGILWQSVAGSSNAFQWYAGTSKLGQWNGTGELMVGSDPGGTERLRVGGSIRAGWNQHAYVGSVFVGNYNDGYGEIGWNAINGVYAGNDYASRIRFASGGFEFQTAPMGTSGAAATYSVPVRIENSGVVSIAGKTTATNAADAKLHVKGKIAAQEVVVTLLNWADHVFAEGYRLPALSEVAAYIKANNHLPGIPSESEVVRDGLGAGDMLAKHMAKIEELTLYAIKADERADALAAENADMRKRQAELEARLARLEQALLRADR